MIDTRPAEAIYIPQGFSFSSACAGIKQSGRPDLALIECEAPANAATVFTRNRVVAAPVIIGREFLKRSRGKVRAVVINSGNANCATGPAGLQGCKAMCGDAAKLLGVRPQHIFPSSTGIIGVPFPREKILATLPRLISDRASTEAAVRNFAATILTTDTRPKIASRTFSVRHRDLRLLGIAKGSGMIHPKLATMLAYIISDVDATPAELQALLVNSCDDTFNCISVDGDTSTNDTVLLLASGRSGLRLQDPGVRTKFRKALMDVCRSLSEQIVSDGEGAQHVIRLHVAQAKNRNEAMRVARAICHSPLVKTAWAGADPNWGRILAAVGNSGVAIDQSKLSIFIGDQRVFVRGQAVRFDVGRAHAHLSQPVCDIGVQLGRGPAGLHFYSTDLSSEYVSINADYST